MKLSKSTNFVVTLLALLTLTACSSSSDDSEPSDNNNGDNSGSTTQFASMTVPDFEESIRSLGLTPSSATKIDTPKSGKNFGYNLTLGTVIVSRVSGGNYTNDLVFAFDIKNETYQEPLENGLSTALYLNTDHDSTSGDISRAIGADIRIISTDNSESTTGIQTWNETTGGWEDFYPGVSGNMFMKAGADTISTTEFIELYTITAGTSDIIGSGDIEATITLERIPEDADNKNHFGSTSAFTIPAL